MKNDIPLQEKKPTFSDYLRTGSCTGEPQVNALNCLRSKDLTVFSDIVNELDLESRDVFPLPDDHWINQSLPEADDKTLLMVAVEERLHDFVKVLLQAGASASLLNQELGKAPLHTAAQVGDLRLLSELFKNEKNQADVNAVIRSNGKTALHICAEKKHEDCLRFLISQRNVDVNIREKKGAQTPLYWAVKSRSQSMVKALIEAGADCNHNVLGKSIQDYLKENLPGFDPSSVNKKHAPILKQVSDATMLRLVELLQSAALFGKKDDTDEFQSLLLQVDSDVLNKYSSDGYTILQKIAEKDLEEFAEVLFRHGDIDPNGTTDVARIPPLLIAAKHGNLKIIRLLSEHKADFTVITDGRSKETVLHQLLQKGNDKDVGKYQACLDFLLTDDELETQMRKIVNKRDHLENTALHYATQMWSQDIVRKLLEIGANIGMKNHWNDIPINKILPQTMEDFLDEFCIESKGDVNHENFEVTFNYSFLAPPKEDLPYENREASSSAVDPETQQLSPSHEAHKVALPETQSLWYMGQSKEHRHLLKHPVVTSFLYLKWGRIRRDFNRNLRFYLLFVYVLTWFIFEKFGGKGIQGEDKKTIPFLHGLFAFFAIIMLFFIIKDWTLDVKDIMKTQKVRRKNSAGEATEEASSGKLFLFVILSNWVEVIFLVFLGIILFGANTVGVLWTSLLVLASLLVMREFFQVTASLKRYLLSPENWLEVTVILIIAFILFYPNEESRELKRHLSAIAIVLSWAELITLVGKHPKLTRYNVYVTMFYKVMGTFLFFLCWYAFFIIAFGLGFYIMLHKDPHDATSLDNPKEEANATEDDYKFFDSPWLALVKTSTMFVGELEFSDIPIDLESPLSPLAYVFFLSFVFLIVVVLMNLLNGLAVSDTGAIQEKAEIYSYISRLDTISYAESILLGDPFNFLANWPALKWLANIPSCSFCAQLYRHRGIQRLFHKITGATGILLFYNVLPDKKLTLTPNAKKHECDFLEVELMDEDIIKSVKTIILKRNAKSETTEMEERIKALEDKIDLLLSKF